MNEYSSRDYAVECLRGATQPDALECPQDVRENRIELSTIYFVLIDSKRPRITNALSLFHTTQVPRSQFLPAPRACETLH